MESNGHHPTPDAVRARVDLPLESRAPRRRRRPPAVLFFGLLVLLVLGAVTAWIIYRRGESARALATETHDQAVPSVLVVHPEVGASTFKTRLPATVQAYMESPVYARVDGYLKSWSVDIGGTVQAGQVLAEIETPEVDQQLSQARASMAQAQADLDLARRTEERWRELLQSKTVAQQEYDEKKSDLDAKVASLASAEANLKRLQDLQSFQKVYAPFDGVVTARNTDVGNLITAGSGSSVLELFRVAQTKTLRVYVSVPEYLSSAVTIGTEATIEMASAPGQKVVGKIVRTSGAIDPATLSMRVELSVDNPDGKLLPGGYAQVLFDVKLDHPPLLIPANALIFRAQNTQVGVVDSGGLVHLSNIHIGRDFGTKLEVLDGVRPEDQIIVNPSDSLADGMRVRVEKTDPKNDQKAATPTPPKMGS